MSESQPPASDAIDHAPSEPPELADITPELDVTGPTAVPFGEPVHVRVGGGREPVRVQHGGTVQHHRVGRGQSQEPLERDFVRVSRDDHELAALLTERGWHREASALLLGTLDPENREKVKRFAEAVREGKPPAIPT